jgi:hypothetical protein
MSGMPGPKIHTCSPLLAKKEKNASCGECERQSYIACTCPEWWFPPDRRAELRKLANGFGGVLSHHTSCAKCR